MRKVPITIVASLAVATMAVTAVAQSGETPPGEGATQITTIDAETVAAMDVLGSSRTTADEMPSEVAESIDESAKFGMNPDLSREAINTIAHDVYVVPADGHICVSLTVGDGANISCRETDDVAEGEAGAATVSLAGGTIAVYGIVPDGVESVEVTIDDASPEVVEVEDNAYLAVLPEGTPLRTVSYTGPSGVVEFPVYDPAAVFEE